ncbi:MAG: SdrD B-like domain-containing protein, partial [Actinomycetota bacterium]
MKKNLLRQRGKTRKATMLFVMATGLSFFLLPFAAYWSQQAAGIISGQVFQDYNGNGTFDTAGSAALPAIDAGIQGVTVTVYASNGTSKSTTTLASGAWSIDTSSAPVLPAGPYRVEFTNLPANYQPSARSADSVVGGTATDSGSTVQFVNNVTTSNINLAINVAEDYCQNNPTLCTSILRPGNQSQTRATTISVPYTAPSANTNLANESQTGTVYGTAYQGSTKTIFQAAYMKRHAGFGSLGTGGVYKINMSSGSPVFSNYVDLQTIGLNTGTDPRVTAGYALPNSGSTPNWDYAAYT